MPKIYNDKNVYEAAMERYQIVFSRFDHIYFSVSGGKDSSIMVQLAARVARQMGRQFSVLYIDLEAQYQATIRHVEQLIELTHDVVDEWYWIAMPLSLRNAVSALQPKWICWDKKDKQKWVRPMPAPKGKNVVLCNEEHYPPEWTWFRRGMEFEEFILYFAEWFASKRGGTAAAGIGIRSDESLNRFRTIVSGVKERYQNYPWTTRIHINGKAIDAYNFYPLYDWTTEDDWTAVARLDLAFNEIYELMYKNGVSIHEQRLCQPYGDDQRKGLDQFRSLEPETWEKVLKRVEGVNFGAIYCRTSLLGDIKSEKPDNMTWQQYAVFLLESIGLYAPEVRDHYYRKIKKFFAWWEKEAGISISEVPDDKWDLKEYNQAPYWKRVARAIEKNDFWMSRLSFSQTKSDVERLFQLKKKYAGLIRGDTQSSNKQLREIAERIESSMKLAKKEFQKGYNHAEFYSIMGQFFAEPKYRKEMPYTRNDSNQEWCLFYSGNDLVGFYSHEQKKDLTVISSLYVLEEYRNHEIYKQLITDIVENFAAARTTTNSSQFITTLLEFGFSEVSRRGSYHVMERRQTV